MRLDDPVDLGDLCRIVIGDRAAVKVAAGFDMIEGAHVQVEVLAFLGQSEAQHDLVRARQIAFADQALHVIDVIAIGGLGAQVRAEVIGAGVAAVLRDRGVAVRLGLLQLARHTLGCGQIEKVLRYMRTSRDRSVEEVRCSLVEAEQAEDSAERIVSFGHMPRDAGRSLSRFKRPNGVTGEE